MATENLMHEADEARWSHAMACALAGDQQAYEGLLHELAGAIETYIRVRFGELNIIEDCVQECLLSLHRGRNTYDPRRKFRPWLFTIVRHKTIDVLRKRETFLVLSDAAAPQATDDDRGGRLLEAIDGLRLLDQLSPDHREVLVLTKYGGYTTREAAASLGISESAAKARLHRALGVIRRHLEREGTPA